MHRQANKYAILLDIRVGMEVAFSPDGKYALTGVGMQQSVYGMSKLAINSGVYGAHRLCYSVAFSPDENTF